MTTTPTSGPEIVVRPAQNTKADLAATKILLEETFAFHAQIAGAEQALQFRPQTQAAYLEDCLWFVQRSAKGETSNELALLAYHIEKPRTFLTKAIEKPAGFAMVRIQRDSFYTIEHYGYIEQLIVTASLRQQGVGAKLLEATYQWLEVHNIHSATLKVYGPNREALKFYQKQGFQSLRHELIKHF
jgi:ribosomal protein S18 acetylase RimI-like enzyme